MDFLLAFFLCAALMAWHVLTMILSMVIGKGMVRVNGENRMYDVKNHGKATNEVELIYRAQMTMRKSELGAIIYLYLYVFSEPDDKTNNSFGTKTGYNQIH